MQIQRTVDGFDWVKGKGENWVVFLSVWMNPSGLLVSILGAFPVLCVLLVPQEAFSYTENK